MENNFSADTSPPLTHKKFRKKYTSMKKCMEFLLSLPVDVGEYFELLQSVGVNVSSLNPHELTNMLIINAAIINQAKNGQLPCIKELRSIVDDEFYTKHKISIDKEKLLIDKNKLVDNNSTLQLDKLDEILKSMNFNDNS